MGPITFVDQGEHRLAQGLGAPARRIGLERRKSSGRQGNGGVRIDIPMGHE